MILGLRSHEIIKSICKQINEYSKQLGIIVNGTQDICGIEQEANSFYYEYI